MHARTGMVLSRARHGRASRVRVQVLHPVFQEDELTLVLVGAVLGLAVGYGQLVWDRKDKAKAAAAAAAAAAADAEEEGPAGAAPEAA